jgi:hypothetical protein
MFEYAARNKLRFPYKGMITAEDLWDLNVRELDSIFKTLNAQVKKAQEESLLETKSKEDEVLSMQIDIVKHIVRIKQDEEAARLFAKERKEKKQKLMELINEKQDEDLHSKSIDELKAMLAELE